MYKDFVDVLDSGLGIELGGEVEVQTVNKSRNNNNNYKTNMGDNYESENEDDIYGDLESAVFSSSHKHKRSSVSVRI